VRPRPGGGKLKVPVHRSTGAPEYRRKKLIANKLKKM
jgi:hypothetical protein